MNARVSLNDFRFEAKKADSQNDTATAATQVALPSQAQFDSVCELIKSVFHVPEVSVALHGAPTGSAGGSFRSFLEIPLINDHAVIGSLRILDDKERDFSDRDCMLLEGFARLVVDQVELWGEASRDVLTGAMTRRAFMEALRKTFAARARTQGRASLVLFDLDHFKRINDTFGHPAGDAVLKAVSKTVLRELRVEDSFGRIGGEEFAVIVANAGVSTAGEVAERLRLAIMNTPIPGHDQIKVTSSFGVSVASDALINAEQWLDIADTQLYAAKSNGRNQVSMAGPMQGNGAIFN
ncbi:MAG: sensor domain-containing diguanylate cyclase [Paracoccaceae bacterium]